MDEDGIYLLVQTNQSHIQVAEAARTQVFCNGQEISVRRRRLEERGFIAQELEFDLARGEPVAIEKIVALYTSRDRAISEECRLSSAAHLAWVDVELRCALLGSGAVGSDPFLEVVHRSPGKRRQRRPGRNHPGGDPFGAMAGTVDLVQRCYIGIEMRDEVLWLNPRLPEDLQGLSLKIRYRSHRLSLDVTRDKLIVSFGTG